MSLSLFPRAGRSLFQPSRLGLPFFQRQVYDPFFDTPSFPPPNSFDTFDSFPLAREIMEAESMLKGDLWPKPGPETSFFKTFLHTVDDKGNVKSLERTNYKSEDGAELVRERKILNDKTHEIVKKIVGGKEHKQDSLPSDEARKFEEEWNKTWKQGLNSFLSAEPYNLEKQVASDADISGGGLECPTCIERECDEDKTKSSLSSTLETMKKQLHDLQEKVTNFVRKETGESKTGEDQKPKETPTAAAFETAT